MDWCGCSPSVFRSDDAPRLRRATLQAKMQYLGRKFEAILDQDIIMRVESGLRNMEGKLPSYISANITALKSYWQNEYDASDDEFHSDFKLILINSLIRTSARNLTCFKNCTAKSVVSMNVFRADDVFKGITVAFDGRCSLMNVEFFGEIFVKLRKIYNIYTNSHFLATNLRSLDVKFV